ncbi:MAG: M23 family metallopeptidase [Candidatus Pacebacteria bacterium]|nr:M23 family metallopeptidase [Candidatus Paceibacterota bacterium]
MRNPVSTLLAILLAWLVSFSAFATAPGTSAPYALPYTYNGTTYTKALQVITLSNDSNGAEKAATYFYNGTAKFHGGYSVFKFFSSPKVLLVNSVDDTYGNSGDYVYEYTQSQDPDDPYWFGLANGVCFDSAYLKSSVTVYQETNFSYQNSGYHCNFNFVDTSTVIVSADADFFDYRFRFPLNGYTPYNAPVSSVFDHSMSTPYGVNDTVTAYNGATGARSNGTPWYDCYRKADLSAFSIYGYTGANGTSYLCYDGHPGIDIDVDVGTHVFSVAPGTVIAAGFDSCLGNHVKIDHGDYVSIYGHLNSIETGIAVTTPATQVYSGTKLGESGNTGSCTSGSHLHFEVRVSNVPVDPYGWQGGGSDPYTATTNKKLWK